MGNRKIIDKKSNLWIWIDIPDNIMLLQLQKKRKELNRAMKKLKIEQQNGVEFLSIASNYKQSPENDQADGLIKSLQAHRF